jgi:hypothetical protein
MYIWNHLPITSINSDNNGLIFYAELNQELLVWRFSICTVQPSHKIICLSPVTQNKKLSHAQAAVKNTTLMREEMG